MSARLLAVLLALAGVGAGDTTEAREVTVALKAGIPGEKERLGYSRPRKIDIETTAPRFLFEIPKLNAESPLFFRIALGETKGTPFYGALDTSPGSDVPDLLYLDKNRDLDLTNDGAPAKARIRTLWTQEGRLVEFLDQTLDLPYAVAGKTETEPYPAVFFYVLAKGETEPGSLLVERDGWRAAAVEIGNAEYAVALIDDDSDGQFSTSDSWVMAPKGTPHDAMFDRDAVRTMLFPSWSADQKWTIEVKEVAPNGRTAKLRIAPAKETEREYFLRVAQQRQTDEEKRLKLDPLRPKADGNEKVDWLVNKDVAYALEIAQNDQTPERVLLDFTARNCAWCALMNKYTFRDREVVQLSKRFVCAKIGFAPGTDDTNKYGVEGTPTYVIIDNKGAEVARHVGFLRPTEFAAWLKSALR